METKKLKKNKNLDW